MVMDRKGGHLCGRRAARGRGHALQGWGQGWHNGKQQQRTARHSAPRGTACSGEQHGRLECRPAHQATRHARLAMLARLGRCRPNLVCLERLQVSRLEGHGRPRKATEGQGRPRKGMEGHGRAWKAMEGHGGSWTSREGGDGSVSPASWPLSAPRTCFGGLPPPLPSHRACRRLRRRPRRPPPRRPSRSPALPAVAEVAPCRQARAVRAPAEGEAVRSPGLAIPRCHPSAAPPGLYVHDFEVHSHDFEVRNLPGNGSKAAAEACEQLARPCPPNERAACAHGRRRTRCHAPRHMPRLGSGQHGASSWEA